MYFMYFKHATVVRCNVFKPVNYWGRLEFERGYRNKVLISNINHWGFWIWNAVLDSRITRLVVFVHSMVLLYVIFTTHGILGIERGQRATQLFCNCYAFVGFGGGVVFTASETGSSPKVHNQVSAQRGRLLFFPEILTCALTWLLILGTVANPHPWRACMKQTNW